MRKYLYTLLLILLGILAHAQPSTMRAAFQSVVSTTPANGGTYAAIGFFLDSDGLGYTEADIRLDTTMLQDNRGYQYRIVYSSGGSPLTLEYDLIEGSGDMNLGFVTIGDPINFDLTKNIIPETGSQITDKSRASNETRFREKLISTDESLQSQINGIALGGNLAVGDQFLTANRLISGQDLYNLTIDSIPNLYILSDEVFMTNGVTSLTNVIGTIARWNTINSGLIKFNDLGVSGMYMQEVYNDSISRVYTTQGGAGIQAFDREGAGITYYGGDISVKPNEVWIRVYDLSNITDSEIRVGFGRVELYGADSMSFKGLDFNESLPTVLAIDTTGGVERIYKKTVNTGNVSYDTYSGVFGVTARISRYAGSGTNVTNPGAGIYTFTVSSGAHVLEIDFLGTDAALSGGGTLTLNIDNSANSRDRFFVVQTIQRTSNGQVDATATATNYTQSSSGNITTIQISNLAGFGGAGYRIMLR